MVVSRGMVRFGIIAALSAPLFTVAACGGAANSAAQSIPKAGDMPEGGDWTGVFYSPTYGYLHIIKNGTTISGKWRTAAGEKWGELHGEVTGNLFSYEWKETRIGMVGPSATTSGRGYFVYVHPAGKNVLDEIHGQWGLGQEQTGVSWDAIKQRNMKPDPDSVVPDETQSIQGGGWDQKKKKPGEGDSDSSSSGDGWN